MLEEEEEEEEEGDDDDDDDEEEEEDRPMMALNPLTKCPIWTSTAPLTSACPCPCPCPLPLPLPLPLPFPPLSRLSAAAMRESTVQPTSLV